MAGWGGVGGRVVAGGREGGGCGLASVWSGRSEGDSRPSRWTAGWLCVLPATPAPLPRTHTHPLTPQPPNAAATAPASAPPPPQEALDAELAAVFGTSDLSSGRTLTLADFLSCLHLHQLQQIRSRPTMHKGAGGKQQQQAGGGAGTGTSLGGGATAIAAK